MCTIRLLEMTNLSPDTQATLLLCSSLGINTAIAKPLTFTEFSSVLAWLKENDLTPQDLLDSVLQNRLFQINLDGGEDRLTALLNRGVALAFSADKWMSQGIWVFGRTDPDYPKRLERRLGNTAPPLIYGVGNSSQLSEGGLAIVGSRNADTLGLDYASEVSKACADQGIQVISGAARGVDETAMLAAITSGGVVIGVLADSLVKISLQSKYREAIKTKKAVLISMFEPDSGFTVVKAMIRNTFIYALSDYALVVSSESGKGGTWAGATQTLRRLTDVPVFVRSGDGSPEGNCQLLSKGAKTFPNSWQDLRKKLEEKNIQKSNG